MTKSNIKIDLSGLKNLQNKLKKYENQTNITLPYTNEQWEKMTEFEKQQAKEQAINEYKDKIIKDINK
jgi:small nuclear ribonucleoprotein (snRNP)-like protein